MGSCLGVGTNFNPRLRTSSSVGDSWASERLTTVLRVVTGHCLLFGSNGTEGSMKGRRSEVGCCHTVIRGEEGGSCFLPVGLQISFCGS